MTPRWNHVAAVDALVADVIAEGRAEIERLDTIYPGAPPIPDDLQSIASLVYAEIAEAEREWPHGSEQKAVAAALRGDVEPLADLLRPYCMPELGVPDEVNPAIKHITPATWAIIAQFLTGERNPRTGRLKGEPGRPKMAAQARRDLNPVHAATAELPAIVDILERHYPNMTKTAIRRRAVAIAARRKSMPADVLTKHIRRPRKDHRRI